ncbi:hypothetical protein [Aestuariispira insulae]|uniref:Uncharacterized protein n=1 Tax=Aestuariispira insulae TaxID=1461337 RepID=A0A3D9H9P6_9PROT|nr:hypothetical protein [Aestuariispira insulae]RED46213.1 hypothetical protein DFP90_110123 [Aestuariispira insulae]
MFIPMMVLLKNLLRRKALKHTNKLPPELDYLRRDLQRPDEPFGHLDARDPDFRHFPY